MVSQSNKAARALRGTAFATLVLVLGTGSPLHGGASAASSPFMGFAGSWSGDGTIKLASGDSERLRCRVTYAVGKGGNSLRQDLRCASDSYKLDVESEISYNADAGRVSGTWAEKNYSTGGFLSGTVSGGDIRARVDGRSFAAEVAVQTNGNQQSVTIRPEGSDVREVAVSLRRVGS